jgi:DNA (cytosine-5)-methyltransferase 1
MTHKLLDLFSGIGGFSLGAEANGIPTVAFVEKDPFCQKVLRKHWSNTPIISDIRTVKGEDYETDGVTIVSGGFPCQPFSQAGKRKGTDDDRYLWDETLRVVTETKPRWFIGENVDGLVNIQDGMVLRSVQDDLEKEGFKVQCLVVPASSIGAWHQRKRVWIIGDNVSNTNDSRDRTSEYGVERQGNKTDDQGRQGQSQSKLADTVKMYPTPSASCQMDVVAPPDTVQNSKGWSVTS